MLKMRLLWRRTSSSQADPSPWRHCWTSWASCSNVSSASQPLRCKASCESASLSKAVWQSISACQLWNVKCSRNVPRGTRAGLPTVLSGILLIKSSRDKRIKHLEHVLAVNHPRVSLPIAKFVQRLACSLEESSKPFENHAF